MQRTHSEVPIPLSKTRYLNSIVVTYSISCLPSGWGCGGMGVGCGGVGCGGMGVGMDGFHPILFRTICIIRYIAGIQIILRCTTNCPRISGRTKARVLRSFRWGWSLINNIKQNAWISNRMSSKL